MLRRTLGALKGGGKRQELLSREAFQKKNLKPRASKPWQRRPEVAGEILLDDISTRPGYDGRAPSGLPHGSSAVSKAGVGMASLFSAEKFEGGEAQGTVDFTSRPGIGSSFTAADDDGGYDGAPVDSDFIEDAGDFGGEAQAGELEPMSGLAASSSAGIQLDGQYSDDTQALAKVAFGKSLDVAVKDVKEYDEGPVNLSVQHQRRTKKEIAESVAIPAHLNSLFHKIMGWSAELQEPLDDRTGMVAGSSGGSSAVGAPDEGLQPQTAKAEKAEAKKKYTEMKEGLEYGALMAERQSDEFALKHNLQTAGLKFEKKFFDWKGMKLLNDPREEMAGVEDQKSSMILHGANGFKIPKVNRDPCPGCGTTLQDKDETAFGHVSSGEIEAYILNHQEKMRARVEYADRMSELQRHWEKNGRRVGEEWLDFMTQEEFNAIHRYIPRPFKCNRCHSLARQGGKFDKSVMRAPDFKEQLRALREKRCVVVLVVDVTEFPGTMVYDLPGLISMNNPVILVLNKCDAIQGRSLIYKGNAKTFRKMQITENYLKKWATEIASQFRLPQHQIKAVVPVSAKKGWGMQTLIDKIEDLSNLTLRRPGPVEKTYFVGCCNVGKSSLINAISKALYVKPPPHPEAKKAYYLQQDEKTGEEKVRFRWYTPPGVNKHEMITMPSYAANKASELMTVSHLPGTTLAAQAVKVSLTGGQAENATYLFDTPGLFPQWYDSTILNQVQIARCLQVKFRNPAMYRLKPGYTFFLGGLAAIDVVKGTSDGIMFAVYASSKVRSDFCPTPEADAKWNEWVGTRLYPPGSLEQTSGLQLTTQKSYLFECYSRHYQKPKADIYVCGLGWISFYTAKACDVVLRVRTLPGVIHGVRRPLRVNDMKGFGQWPKLPRMERTADEPKPAVDTVIELTSGPFRPEDPPMQPVEPTTERTTSKVSDAPLREAMERLAQMGKA